MTPKALSRMRSVRACNKLAKWFEDVQLGNIKATAIQLKAAKIRFDKMVPDLQAVNYSAVDADAPIYLNTGINRDRDDE